MDWREFRRAGLALHSLGELTATAPQPPPVYPLSMGISATLPAAAAAAAASYSLTSSSTSVASSVRSSAPGKPPPAKSPQHTAFARRDYEAEGRVVGAVKGLAALEGRVRRTSVQLMRGAYRRLVREA